MVRRESSASTLQNSAEPMAAEPEAAKSEPSEAEAHAPPAPDAAPAPPKPGKAMREAIIVALNRETFLGGKVTTPLHLIAERLVEKASEGDMPAIREILDRLEGKASTIGAGSGGDKDAAHHSAVNGARDTLLAKLDRVAQRNGDQTPDA